MIAWQNYKISVYVIRRITDLLNDLPHFTRRVTQALTESLVRSLHDAQFTSEFRILLFNSWKTNINLNYT